MSPSKSSQGPILSEQSSQHITVGLVDCSLKIKKKIFRLEERMSMNPPQSYERFKPGLLLHDQDKKRIVSESEV